MRAYEEGVPEIWVVDLERKTVHHCYRRKGEYVEEQVQERDGLNAMDIQFLLAEGNLFAGGVQGENMPSKIFAQEDVQK